MYTILDLLTRAGVADRCEVVGGSFFEAVPGGTDAYLLKSIIHDWDYEAAIEILNKCRATIADIRRLLLVEFVIQPGNEPDRAKFSDLNMLVMLGGRERTVDDFERLYAGAGFRLTDIIRTGTPFCIIEGTGLICCARYMFGLRASRGAGAREIPADMPPRGFELLPRRWAVERTFS